MAATYRQTFDASGNPTRIKDDFAAAAAPDANDDFATGGWVIGSLQYVPSTNTLYIAESVGTGAAVWTTVGGAAAHSALSGLTSGDDHTQYLLESTWNAKGDLISASANDTPSVVTVGANGSSLVADSTQTAGLRWATGAVGELLISDTPSTPLVFADILQNDDEDALLYADL